MAQVAHAGCVAELGQHLVTDVLERGEFRPLDADERRKARERLKWILEAPLNKDHEREDEGYKRDAEELLQKL